MYTLIGKLGKRAILQRVKGTLLSANSEIHQRRDNKEAPVYLCYNEQVVYECGQISLILTWHSFP